MSKGLQMRIRIPPDLEDTFKKAMQDAEDTAGVTLTPPQFVVAIIKRHLKDK